MRLVSPGGTSSFSEIQDAVNAAQDGDLILVGSGTYASVLIQDKALSIFATPGSAALVHHRVTVTGLAANKSVVLHGLHLENTSGYGFFSPVLVVAQCAGRVRVQDCDVVGEGPWFFSLDCPTYTGSPAVQISGSDSVALLDCSAKGGAGSIWVSGMDCTGEFGSPGVEVSASRLVLHGTIWTGGAGSDAKGAGVGGVGILSNSASEIDSSGGAAIGGKGGFDYHSSVTTSGGKAGKLNSGVWRALGTTFVKGVSEPVGPFVDGDVYLTLLPGTPRTLDAAAFGTPGTRFDTTVTGLAGDQVLALASLAMGHHLVESTQQVWLGAWPFHQVTPPVSTTLPASGSGAVPAMLPHLASGRVSAVVTLQAKVAPFHAPALFSDARMVLVLDPGVGGDCDGSGLGDLYEIALGLVPDANHNLIPDTCPGG